MEPFFKWRMNSKYQNHGQNIKKMFGIPAVSNVWSNDENEGAVGICKKNRICLIFLYLMQEFIKGKHYSSIIGKLSNPRGIKNFEWSKGFF